MARLHEGEAGTLYFSTTPRRYAETIRRLTNHLRDVAMIGRVVLRDEDQRLSGTSAGRFHVETFLSECRGVSAMIFGIETFDPELAERARVLFLPIQRIVEVERQELAAEIHDMIEFCDPQ
jgi:hypothetical protein